jgi:hypothetical protein
MRLYDYFGELYQSGKSQPEITIEIERLIYSSRFCWKAIRPGVGSSLLQTAVFNTLQETARKRRSTFAEVSSGFYARRSIISDIIQKQSERPTAQPIDEFLQHLSFFALTAHRVADTEEELNKLSEISILLNACSTARKNFDAFIAPENFMTAASLQKKATSVVGMYRSIGSIDSIAYVAQLCYVMPSLVNLGLEYAPQEILERTNCLRQLVESWITGVREDTLSKEHGKLIFAEIDRIIERIGYIAYFIGKKVDFNDVDVQKVFERGVISAVHELAADIPEILEQCSGEKTTRERFKKLSASFVAELLKYTVDSFNEELIFEVLRKAILIKEQTLTMSEDRAVKVIEKINELISAMEMLSLPLKPESVELVKNGLIMWKQLSRISCKPPLAPRPIAS